MITITHHPGDTLQWTARIDLTGTLAEELQPEVSASDTSPGAALEKCYRDVGCYMCLTMKRPKDPMTDPSPYEQGYRDALLTAKALTRSLIVKLGNANSEGEWAFEEVERELDKLIDLKNHDLWNLLALAQVDLSAYPEAEALRAMLRAPTGVLIDSGGRVLFIRLNGTEYDTGVLALLDENARLKAAAEKAAPETFTFTVNGRDWHRRHGAALTYEDLCLGAGVPLGASVSYHGKGNLGESWGSISAGCSIVASPGMAFYVS